MSRHDTGAACVVCKQTVVAEVKKTPSLPMEDMPIGPSWVDYYVWEVVFSCSNPDCGLQYKHPPGQPNARDETLRKAKQR